MANNMPLGTNLPLYANGLEILATAWFKSKESKTKGVYMPKKIYDNLLKDEFISIEKKISEYEYGERILNRIKNSFQLGANEKVSIFFDEIGGCAWFMGTFR